MNTTASSIRSRLTAPAVDSTDGGVMAGRGSAPELCPQCGTARIGAFRFCRACAFDFETRLAAAKERAWAMAMLPAPTLPAGASVTSADVPAPSADEEDPRTWGGDDPAPAGAIAAPMPTISAAVGAPSLRVRLPSRPRLRRAASAVGLLTLAILLGAWFFLLRPVALGGPASYVVVAGVSMEPRLQSGDLVIVQTAAVYHVGDVVAYHIPAGQPLAGSLIIHRIIGGDGAQGFVMQGDNKKQPDPWRPTASEIVGKSWLEFAGSGRLLLGARTPLVLATVLGGLAAFLFFTSGSGRPREPRPTGAGPLRFWRRGRKTDLHAEAGEP